MRKWKHIIALSFLAGFILSLLFVSYRAVRGRYVAIDKTEYLYRGDTYCRDVGYINTELSSAWLSVRYQEVREINGELRLCYDWGEILYNLSILFMLFSFLSVLPVSVVMKRISRIK